MPDVRATVAARALPGVGDVAIATALGQPHGVEQLIADRDAAAQARAWAEADATIAAAQRIGAQIITLQHDGYPELVRELPDAPAVLYAHGVLATSHTPTVAIVGTRRASSYGLRVARAIATSCARAGVCVVSGLAEGIDGAAHEAALAAGGRTVAVLGTGVDVAFPRRHRELQSRIARDGLLLSELPPGVPGHGGAFPRRNRIIAALALLTIVVEAGERSGALITASCAMALGKRVAVVPNAIDVPSAFGSNALLRLNEVHALVSPDDVLEWLELRAQPTPAPVLDGDAASCWDALQHGADSLRGVAEYSGMSVRAVSVALSALEIEGLVVIEPTGRIRVTVGALAGAERSS